MNKLTLVAGVASLGLAVSAFAGSLAANNNGLYAGVNGGAAIPTMNGNTPLNTGFTVGGHVGYRLSNFRFEEAYDYLNNGTKTGTLARYLGVKNVQFGALMTNAYYDFNTGTNFVPYVGGGIGWMHTWANSSYSNVHITSANNFAYQGIAGVDYKLNQNSTVGVNYRYLTTDNNAADAAQNIVGVSYNYYF